MLLCIRNYLLVLSISFVLLYMCEGKLEPAQKVINPPECGRVQVSSDENSGHIYDFIKGIEWVNCTFELNSRIKSSGALVVIRIFAIELHTAHWSEIIMPAGDHISHNLTTPDYREGELPWCGIYLKKESSRLRASNEGLCPGSIYKSKTWPPKLTINAKSLRLSLWYAFLDCRNKARPVDVDEIDADLPSANDDPFLTPITSSTGPPAPAPTTTSLQPNLTPTICTETSTRQSYQNVSGSQISYEKEFHIALIGIGVLLLLVVIIGVILVRICTKKSVVPVVVEKTEEPNSPTYRQYDQVTTLPHPKRSTTNHSFRPPPPPVTEDREESSNYQYIDLPVFANSPTTAVPPDHHRMFTNTTSINETLSDCTSDKPMMSTSSEFVANELYHLPKC